jgi:hypothetical protein
MHKKQWILFGSGLVENSRQILSSGLTPDSVINSGFEVLTAGVMKRFIFRDIIYIIVRGTCHLHLQG